MAATLRPVIEKIKPGDCVATLFYSEGELTGYFPVASHPTISGCRKALQMTMGKHVALFPGAQVLPIKILR